MKGEKKKEVKVNETMVKSEDDKNSNESSGDILKRKHLRKNYKESESAGRMSLWCLCSHSR